MQKAKWLPEVALQIAEKEEKLKANEERKYIPIWMQSFKEYQGEIRKTSSVIYAKKWMKTIGWERLEISSRKSEILTISCKDEQWRAYIIWALGLWAGCCHPSHLSTIPTTRRVRSSRTVIIWGTSSPPGLHSLLKALLRERIRSTYHVCLGINEPSQLDYKFS